MNRLLTPMLAVAVSGCGFLAPGGPDTALEQRTSSAVLVNCFEAAWQMVADGHYDSTFGGQDWRAMHDMYRPLVAAARSDADFPCS